MIQVIREVYPACRINGRLELETFASGRSPTVRAGQTGVGVLHTASILANSVTLSESATGRTAETTVELPWESASLCTTR